MPPNSTRWLTEQDIDPLLAEIRKQGDWRFKGYWKNAGGIVVQVSHIYRIDHRSIACWEEWENLVKGRQHTFSPWS